MLKAAALAAAASAVCSAGSIALAQVDPFANIPVPRPKTAAPAGATPAAPANPNAPRNRVGFTGVEQAVGRGYAGAQTTGSASTLQIRTLPKTVAPIPVALKATSARNLAGRPRIAAPTYALALVRQGEIRASSAGQGSELAPRATKISTILVGVDDALAQQLADEAHADLIRRLTAAGFDVVPPSEVQASKEMARLAVVGDRIKGQNDWMVYAPKAAPLRSGHAYSKAVMAASGAAIVFNDASVEMNAVMISPYLAIDYASYEGSGNRTYAGSASAAMNVRFRVANAGANFLYGRDKGKGGGIYGFLNGEPTGSSEPFGVLFEVDDRSDDVAINNAFATMGLGSIYRQSKYYGVEAVPDRYAALVRAAFQGLNQSIVAEIQKARQ